MVLTFVLAVGSSSREGYLCRASYRWCDRPRGFSVKMGRPPIHSAQGIIQMVWSATEFLGYNRTPANPVCAGHHTDAVVGHGFSQLQWGARRSSLCLVIYSRLMKETKTVNAPAGQHLSAALFWLFVLQANLQIWEKHTLDFAKYLETFIWVTDHILTAVRNYSQVVCMQYSLCIYTFQQFGLRILTFTSTSSNLIWSLELINSDLIHRPVQLPLTLYFHLTIT